MNKYVYHGTAVGGLKKLTPSKSTHLKPYVYATTSKVIAVLFMSHSNGDLDTVISGCGTKEDPCTITERWDGAFEKNYNKSGYIYTLDSKNFKKVDGLWGAEVVSEKKENIVKKEYVPCIYNELKKYSKSGELIMYKYPSRPPYLPIDNSDLIERYSNYEKSGIRGALKGVLNVYPEFEDIIYKKLYNKKLLALYIVTDKEELDSELLEMSNGRGSLSLKGYVAYDSKVKAIECAKPFIREEGCISYDIIEDKFVFKKGHFDTSKKFYIYKMKRKGFIRVNSNTLYSVNNPCVSSKELIDLNNYSI